MLTIQRNYLTNEIMIYYWKKQRALLKTKLQIKCNTFISVKTREIQ